jgi:cation transport protein ChaC
VTDHLGTSDAAGGAADGVWVFAYGSLMWRPGFAYQEATPATLRGYHRSLCIYSVHHRGTEERPGLVFGLDRGGACKGWAFRVPPAEAEAVIAYLDERELVTDVYRRKRLSVVTEHGPVPAWCYVVRRDHAQYAGRLAENELLHLVRNGVGQSGHCRDYVLSTVGHLEEMDINDQALASLARLLAADAAATG